MYVTSWISGKPSQTKNAGRAFMNTFKRCRQKSICPKAEFPITDLKICDCCKPWCKPNVHLWRLATFALRHPVRWSRLRDKSLCYILSAYSVQLTTVRFALFLTVFNSPFTDDILRLHWNEIEHECEAISGKSDKIARNCLMSMLNYIVMQISKVWKVLLLTNKSTVSIRLNASAFIKFFVIRLRRLFEGGVYLQSNLFFTNNSNWRIKFNI